MICGVYSLIPTPQLYSEFPCLLKTPGRCGGRRIDHPTSTIDIVPTLLAELGYSLEKLNTDGLNLRATDLPEQRIRFANSYMKRQLEELDESKLELTGKAVTEESKPFLLTSQGLIVASGYTWWFNDRSRFFALVEPRYVKQPDWAPEAWLGRRPQMPWHLEHSNLSVIQLYRCLEQKYISQAAYNCLHSPPKTSRRN